jgi:hypothetical protein
MTASNTSPARNPPCRRVALEVGDSEWVGSLSGLGAFDEHGRDVGTDAIDAATARSWDDVPEPFRYEVLATA